MRMLMRVYVCVCLLECVVLWLNCTVCCDAIVIFPLVIATLIFFFRPSTVQI